jgi:ATP-dependent Lon protease
MANLQLNEMEAKIPEKLALLVLRDVVAFPHLVLPLFVGRNKSIKAVEYALEKDKLVFLVAQRDFDIENPDAEDIYSIGTVGIILRTMRVKEKGDKLKALIQGLCKARIFDIIQMEPFWMATLVKEETGKSQCEISEIEPLVLAVKEKLDQLIFNYGKEVPVEVIAAVENFTDPKKLAHLIAANLGLEPFQAQEILEIDDPVKKLLSVSEILDEQIGLFREGKTQKGHDG